MISDFPAIVDACVLVQAAVRDTLLRLSERRLFLARWTDEIIEETLRALRDRLGRTQEQAEHLASELQAHFPEAWIEPSFRELIPAMTNHHKDRHIFAAAVKGQCQVIITYNLRHFPEQSMKPHGIEVKHPDEFLIDLYHVDSEIVVHELHQQGADLNRAARHHGSIEITGNLQVHTFCAADS